METKFSSGFPGPRKLQNTQLLVWLMPFPEAMKFILEPLTILRLSMALSHCLELIFPLVVLQFDNCLDYTN